MVHPQVEYTSATANVIGSKDMSLGLQRGQVKLVPYNPEWADLFELEKNAIKQAFREKILGIEHIGSTAIPGMIAKPILDFMIAVDSLDEYELYTQELEKLGYQFRRDERSELEHILYVKGPEEKRTHYLKLTTLDSEFWKDHILFRDYLIEHPERAKKYSDLKQKLLEKHGGERENYTKEKENYINETLELALKGSQSLQ